MNATTNKTDIGLLHSNDGYGSVSPTVTPRMRTQKTSAFASATKNPPHLFDDTPTPGLNDDQSVADNDGHQKDKRWRRFVT